MVAARNRLVALYVDRASHQWIVRDADGAFWSVPWVEDAWDHRRPYELAEETELEQVPGHYIHMLGLPS